MKWALTAAVIIVLLALAAHRFELSNQAAAHMLADQRTDLAIVAQAISKYEIQHPGSLSASQITNFDASTLYQLLTRTNAESSVRVLIPRDDWDSLSVLVDRWGQPLNIRVRLLTKDQGDGKEAKRAVFTLWSSGPNGRNESCTGDDISISFAIRISE